MARRSTAKLKPPPASKASASKPVNLGWLGGTVGFYLRTAQEAAFQAFARKANGASRLNATATPPSPSGRPRPRQRPRRLARRRRLLLGS